MYIVKRTQGKKGLTVAIVVLVVVLLVVGGLALSKKSPEPAKTTAPNTSKDASTTKDTTTETDSTGSGSSTTTTATTVDPATLTSIAIEPLGVTVFYSKGTPGFEFTVLKTADQTQYVEFTSSDLIGTKCTNDQGVFASIIKNPAADESQTTSQTVKVGSDTYGLSLASASCTANPDLLTQYQTGFKNGFSSLAAL